ncbi:hypothetical protein DQK91_23615 [Oceanidesulfovibrio marinus]|uniref:Uncharacterized protein n=2 Tax=Oceanidesulfovibrio marinus TaxID=370038 RepID=A0A6P1ZAV8_9BACT|nr:hypothetical protein DQK91_23615 [Oceanidesulfovibrio marinus]
MAFRNKAYDYMEIEAGQAKDRPIQLADIDLFVATEFDVYFSSILAKSIASTITKLLTQVVAENTLVATGALIMGIFYSLTTQADTRMWTSLPKAVQGARIPLPEDGHLLLPSPQGVFLSEIDIPNCNACIVSVRITKANVTAAVATLPL